MKTKRVQAQAQSLYSLVPFLSRDLTSTWQIVMQIYDWSNWSPDMNDPSTFVALACVWFPLAKPNASAAASARKTEKFEYLALALALELSLHEAVFTTK